MIDKRKTYTLYACAHKDTGAATLQGGITTWRGRFFDDTDTGEFTQSTFGFTVNGEWDGEDEHEF